MSSVSGLSPAHRDVARRIIVQGAHELLSRPGDVNYSQGPERWEAINRNIPVGSAHLFPFTGDCSSTATWLLWNALHVTFGVHDIVNGENWQAGYTGTIAMHGKIVRHDANIQIGDLILYGPRPTFEHVVVSLGGRKVFSHGSQAGPFPLDLDYRPDRGPTHRFI